VILLHPCAAAADIVGPSPAGWPQPGGPGSPVVITYSFSNLLDGSFAFLTQEDLHQATVEALQTWAAYAPLHFVERIDSGPAVSDAPYPPGDHPLIRIGHHPMTDLAHAFLPDIRAGLAGDIHLDPGIPWALSGKWNFLEAVTHEAGHAIGLGHVDDEPSVMNPFFPQPLFGALGSAFLFPGDIRRLQEIYGAGTGSVQPLGVNPVPEPASIVLVASGLGLVLEYRRRRRNCLHAIPRPARTAMGGQRRPMCRKDTQSI
jgi:hypothetical protein